MKVFCLVLIAVSAVIILWLTFSVLPGKAVMQLEQIAEKEPLHGPVFGVLSSSSKGGQLRTEIVQRDEWRRVTDFQTGWGAVTSWAPYAFIVSMVSYIFGCFTGWGVRGKDAEIEANKSVETDFAHTKEELALTKAELANSKNEKEARREVIERFAADIASTKVDFAFTKSELARTKECLQETEDKLRVAIEILERERGENMKHRAAL